MATSFHNALGNLAVMSVTGVTHNYSIYDIPETLERPELPVLLVMPLDTQDNRLFREKGSGFQAMAFASGTHTVNYTMTHLLLVAPVNNTGMRDHLPTLVNIVDAYFDAIKLDALLGGQLLEPTQIHVEPDIYEHGGVRYFGCAFRHSWLIEV